MIWQDIIHNRSARADGYSPIERSDTHNNCETYCKYISGKYIYAQVNDISLHLYALRYIATIKLIRQQL